MRRAAGRRDTQAGQGGKGQVRVLGADEAEEG